MPTEDGGYGGGKITLFLRWLLLLATILAGKIDIAFMPRNSRLLRLYPQDFLRLFNVACGGVEGGAGLSQALQNE
jgi:hypothetical protein